MAETHADSEAPNPGDPLPMLPGHTSHGRFERVLRGGHFAVSTEIAPPDSSDPEEVLRRAALFDGHVDAINATDGSGANCHMSSLGVCAILTREGCSFCAKAKALLTERGAPRHPRPTQRPQRHPVSKQERERHGQGHRRPVRPAQCRADDHPQHFADGAAGQTMQCRHECRARERRSGMRLVFMAMMGIVGVPVLLVR